MNAKTHSIPERRHKLSRRQAHRLALRIVGRRFTPCMIETERLAIAQTFFRGAERCREKVKKWNRYVALMIGSLMISFSSAFVLICFSEQFSVATNTLLSLLILAAFVVSFLFWRAAALLELGQLSRLVAKKWSTCRNKALRTGTIDRLTDILLRQCTSPQKYFDALLLAISSLRTECFAQIRRKKVDGTSSMRKACKQKLLLIEGLCRELCITDLMLLKAKHVVPDPPAQSLEVQINLGC